MSPSGGRVRRTTIKYFRVVKFGRRRRDSRRVPQLSEQLQKEPTPSPLQSSLFLTTCLSPPVKRRGQGSGGRTARDQATILRLLAEGLTQREVAEQTGWSEHTVWRRAPLPRAPPPSKSAYDMLVPPQPGIPDALKPRTIRNYSTTPESLREIQRLKAEGLTQEKVAELTGWTTRTVRKIWNRKAETGNPKPANSLPLIG